MRSEIIDNWYKAFGLFKYRLTTQPGEVLKNPHVGIDCMLNTLFFAASKMQPARKWFPFADNKRDVPLHGFVLSALWVAYLPRLIPNLILVANWKTKRQS